MRCGLFQIAHKSMKKPAQLPIQKPLFFCTKSKPPNNRLVVSPKEFLLKHMHFKLKANELIYLFTDGFADQFGGLKNKKFKYSSLKKLLLSVGRQGEQEQREALKKSFDTWKGTVSDDLNFMRICKSLCFIYCFSLWNKWMMFVLCKLDSEFLLF
jgi:hypothetical protein